jgi:hypothetical protein
MGLGARWGRKPSLLRAHRGRCAASQTMKKATPTSRLTVRSSQPVTCELPLRNECAVVMQLTELAIEPSRCSAEPPEP